MLRMEDASPHTEEGSCECTVKVVTDNSQWVVLQCKGWSEGLITRHRKNRTSYKMLHGPRTCDYRNESSGYIK
jgi:hypothetical protein